jgi:hypothetical protein
MVTNIESKKTIFAIVTATLTFGGWLIGPRFETWQEALIYTMVTAVLAYMITLGLKSLSR